MLSDIVCREDGKIGPLPGLNAPFGARWFLTGWVLILVRLFGGVLMHLMALGAF